MPTTIYTGVLTQSTPGYAGTTCRSEVPITGGSLGQVRVTFSSPGLESLTLTHASIGISLQNATGSTTAVPVELTFAGLSGFDIPFGGTLITSDWVNLPGFTAADLLIVVEDVAAGGTGFISYEPQFSEYEQAATASYNVATVSGYTNGGATVGVVLIETQAAGGAAADGAKPKRLFTPGKGPTKGLSRQGAFPTAVIPGNITLVGVGMTASAGSLAEQVNDTITGVGLVATAGVVADQVNDTITGVGITAAAGTITVTAGTTFNVTGVGITLAAGSILDQVNDTLLGVGIVTAAGAITPQVSKTLTGVGLTVTAGSLIDQVSDTILGVGVTLTAGVISIPQPAPDIIGKPQGFLFKPGAGPTWNLRGRAAFPDPVQAPINITLTGVGMTTTAGSLSDQSAPNITGVGVLTAAGTVIGQVGATLTGVSLTATPGAITKQIQYSLLGVGVTTTAGSVSFSGAVNAAVTGVAITTAAGIISDIVTTTLLGVGATATAGSITSQVQDTLLGVGITLSAGLVAESPSTNLSGVRATLTAGIITITEQITLLGVGIVTAAGTIAPVSGSFVSVPGVGIVTAAGTISFQLSTNISLVGVGMSLSAGSLVESSSYQFLGVHATLTPGLVLGNPGGVLSGVPILLRAGTITMAGVTFFGPEPGYVLKNTHNRHNKYGAWVLSSQLRNL